MKKIITFEKKLEFPSMIAEVTSISLDQQLKFKDSSNIDGLLIVKGTYKRTEATRLEEDFNFELPTEILLTEKIDLDSSRIDIDDFFYEIENDETIICHIDILVEGIEIVDVDDSDDENIILDNHERQIDEISNETELRECDGDSSYESEEIAKKIEEKIEKNENEKKLDSNKENKNISEEQNNLKEEQKPKDIEQREKEEEIMEKEENLKIESVEEKEENIEVGSLFTSLKDSEETFQTYSVYIVREEETIEKIMEKYKISKEALESYNDLSTITKGSKLIIPYQNDTN